MSEEHPPDEPYFRDEGHRYERPDTMRERAPKTVTYAVLAVIVIVIALLIATGKVPMVPNG